MSGRMLRRGAMAVLLLGLAVLGAGWLAIGASGDGRSGARRAEAHADVPAAKLPPLPKKMRPRVVEPEAGAVESVAPVEPDPGLDDPGPKPTRAASSGGTRPEGVLAGAGGGVSKATALSNGVALPPLEAPEEVKQIIEAGNAIARAPYKWGGGHGRWKDNGYDCSGSVSFALAAAGLLGGPLDSSRLMHWGEAGPGKWVTIYSNPGHVYMEVAGIRFDTSGARSTGSRWQSALRSHGGFVARHPAGL